MSDGFRVGDKVTIDERRIDPDPDGDPAHRVFGQVGIVVEIDELGWHRTRFPGVGYTMLFLQEELKKVER